MVAYCKILLVSVPQRSGVLFLQKDHESYHSFSALWLLVLGTHPGPLNFNFQKYLEEDLRRGQNCIDHLDTAHWVKKEISVCSRKHLSLQSHPFQIQVTRIKNKLLIMLYNIRGAKHDLGHVHSALPWPLNNQKEFKSKIKTLFHFNLFCLNYTFKMSYCNLFNFYSSRWDVWSNVLAVQGLCFIYLFDFYLFVKFRCHPFYS